MQEFDLIRLLCRDLPANDSVRVGPGDDCAVLDLGLPGKFVLFKTDAVVEGIHFTPDAKPESVGHKALGRCLSDIAAMAGTPTAAVITIGLPRQFQPEFVQKIYAGLNALAQAHGVAIVGGETSTNPERIFISVAMLGTVEQDKCILRSGAKPGDAIFVTGELGGSLAGKHLEFEPRLAEARWLAAHWPVHAMIDLSDGLAGDLPHILKASNVGAELLSSAIPISRAAKLRARQHGGHPPMPSPANGCAETKKAPLPQTPLSAALTDGEDFELLFTTPAAHAVPLHDAWKKQFPALRLSCIGKITSQPGLTIRDKKGFQPLHAHGYVHFRES